MSPQKSLPLPRANLGIFNLETTLVAAQAFVPRRQGRLQGGTDPDSKAVMIWLVIPWRMSVWLGMTDSQWGVVGNSRPIRRCQFVAEERRK